LEFIARIACTREADESAFWLEIVIEAPLETTTALRCWKSESADGNLCRVAHHLHRRSNLK